MQFDGKSDRIAATLRQKIVSGELKPGDRLPTTLALAAEYEVAKSTVTQALALLAEEKLIIARRGTGCRVQPVQATGRRPEIGFYIPRIASDNFPRAGQDIWSIVISGAAAAAAEAGYKLTFIPALGKSVADDLRESGCRNLLIHGGDPDFFEEFISSPLRHRLHFVMLNRAADFRRINAVDEFSFDAGLALCRELALQGFRRIALLGTAWEAFDYTRIFPAHAQYLYEQGLAQHPLVYRIPETLSEAEFDSAVRTLWNSPVHPEVLVIFRVRFLEGTMRALERIGVRVPEDLPVLLVESLRHDSPWEWHGMRLSAYALPPKQEFGAAAAQLLIDGIGRPEREPVQIGLPLVPVFGESCPLPPQAKIIGASGGKRRENQ